MSIPDLFVFSDSNIHMHTALGLAMYQNMTFTTSHIIKVTYLLVLQFNHGGQFLLDFHHKTWQFQPNHHKKDKVLVFISFGTWRLRHAGNLECSRSYSLFYNFYPSFQVLTMDFQSSHCSIIVQRRQSYKFQVL